MKISILSLFVFSLSLCQAQSISYNDVDAHIGNVPGRLFMNSATGGNAGYEVPKGSGHHTFFAASLWCAAIDDTGTLHVAASRFAQSGADFFAGPYSTTDDYLDSSYLSEYGSSVWYATNAEIQNHIASYWQTGYVMPSNIANWPGNGINNVGVETNLAPFVDNNNNGIYEPAIGEYPDIRGDQACYLILNDAAGPHTETGGLTLGIEIHTMLYQYSTTDYRDKTTYMNYRIFNRGNNNYAAFKFAIWADFDLGNASDDYVGCDVTHNLMYAYNADNNDETSGGQTGYGFNPPAAGIVTLNKTMQYFTYFTNGAAAQVSDPITALQYYNYMQGKWANGAQMYFGGDGFSTGTSTLAAKYMFPGDSDPTHIGTGGVNPGIMDWTEVSNGNPAGDRRGVMTLEDAVLNAGDNECYDFAVLYSREAGNDNLQNVTSLRAQSALAKIDFDAMTNYNCDQVTLSLENLDESQIGLFPNPTTGSFTLSFGDEVVNGTVQVLNMKGQVVLTDEISNENVKILNLDTQNGVYNVIIKTDSKTVHKRLIKVE